MASPLKDLIHSTHFILYSTSWNDAAKRIRIKSGSIIGTTTRRTRRSSGRYADSHKDVDRTMLPYSGPNPTTMLSGVNPQENNIEWHSISISFQAQDQTEFTAGHVSDAIKFTERKNYIKWSILVNSE